MSSAVPYRTKLYLQPFPLVLALYVVSSTGVLAKEGGVLRPYVSYSFTYDDNVLGLPNVNAAVAATGDDQMGDYSQTMQGGLLIDKRLGRQRLTANLAGSKMRFDHFRQLDNTGRDLSASWQWQLGTQFQGNLGVSDIRALVPYVAFHKLERNTRTQQHRNLDGSWLLNPNWRLSAGLARYALFHDLRSQQTGDRTDYRIDLAVDYLPRSGSTVGLLLRRTDGNHPVDRMLGDRAITNSFLQQEIKARVYWRLSDKTKATFTGGYVSRKHAMLSSRDSKGPNGRIEAEWASTGKTSIRSALWRETGVVDNLTTDYSINSGMSVEPKWRVSEKNQVEATVKVERHDFSQSLAFLPPAAEELDDRVRTFSLKLIYRPMVGSLVKVGAFHLSRTAKTSSGIDFKRKGITVVAQHHF